MKKTTLKKWPIHYDPIVPRTSAVELARKRKSRHAGKWFKGSLKVFTGLGFPVSTAAIDRCIREC